MSTESTASRSGWWFVLLPVALVLYTTATASGRTARYHFFAALRIARPEAVSVNVPAFSGPTGSRRLQDAVAAMLASGVNVSRETSDTAVADSAAASRIAGFAPHLIPGRAGAPRFTVRTPRVMSMAVSRAQLQTTMMEAAQSGASIPQSVDGDSLAISTPAAIVAQYGHCPVAEGQTLTNQIAQRPPPTAENADCLMLEQRPTVSAQVPSGLDMNQLTGIALEVAGMSPVQMTAFQHAIPWNAALALTMPRFIRAYDSVSVNGAPAMLINTAARRGPTYELLWTAGGRVFTLTGYGNSSDAVALAASIHTASAPGGRP